MKVVHTISGLGRGGAEHMLARLVASMPQVQHVVVSLSGRGVLAESIECAGARLYSLDSAANGTFSALRSLRAIGRDESPDIIQGWMNHGNLAASVMGGARSRRRVVWNVRQSLADLAFETWRTRQLIRLQALASGLPASIIYNSTRGANEHEAIGFRKERRIVVPNGFDVDQFRPDDRLRDSWRKTFAIGDGEVAVGFVARFHPWKNHTGFIAAAHRLLPRFPQLRFVFVGEGATLANAEFSTLVGSGPLASRGIFLGDRNDVASVATAFDAVCNASHGEGFPNAVGEAMATGIPCVVTPVGASEELVGPTGFVARSTSVEDLSAALGDMIALDKETRQRLGKAARARIVQHFSIEAVARVYAALYERLVTSQNGTQVD